MITGNNDSVQEVVLAELQIDHTYQRPLKKYHKKMAKNFRPDAVGFLHVNVRPDYTQWVVDGQQRWACLMLLGHKTWKAHITTLATVEEEARLYTILNGGQGTRVGVTERDLFRSLIIACDPIALATIAAVEAGGLKMLVVHPGRKWPYLGSSRLARRVVSAYGPELLRRICSILAQSWPGDDVAMDSYIFMGVSMFVQAFPDLKDSVIVKSFSRRPALYVLQQARSRLSYNNIAAGVRDVLIDLYNYNRKSRHRIVYLGRSGEQTTPMQLPDRPEEVRMEEELAKGGVV